MADPKNKPGYNEYRPDTNYEFQRAYKTTFVSAVTLDAFIEIASIDSWAEFVRICNEQKRKREW